MKERDNIKEMLSLQELSSEEKSQRGILGRLYGPCASISVPTRNGRLYGDSLWKAQFSENEILKEMFANGGIPMELDHPEDREEICSEKIAAIMPEPPVTDNDGHLICYVDILDTPCGRIAYQLAKYGFKLGISSRGTGDIYTDDDGNEAVDPDTYDLTTFDLVLVPAVKDARLTMLEGLDKNKAALQQALRESINSSSETDKNIMIDTIKHLNIGINTSDSDNIDLNENSNSSIEAQESANNNGDSELLKSLQESIKSKTELEKTVKQLQETLAVSNAKVEKLEEDVDKYKEATIRLSDKVRLDKQGLEKVASLEESLKEKTNLVDTLNSQLEKLQKENIHLREQYNKSTNEIKTSLTEKYNKIEKDSKKEIQSLKEDLSAQKEMYENKISNIESKYAVEKKDSTKTINELNEKLSKNKKVIENYKTLANNIVEKYINTKATMLGIEGSDIKAKLSEKYTLSDIDRVCEELQSYKLDMSTLPVSLTGLKNNSAKAKVITNNPIKKVSDDDVDDNLLSLAGLL